MHDQMIRQMRLLFETNVTRVTLVLFRHHVISCMLIERSDVGEGFETDVAGERLVSIVIGRGFLGMRFLDMRYENLSRRKVRLLADVASELSRDGGVRQGRGGG